MFRARNKVFFCIIMSSISILVSVLLAIVAFFVARHFLDNNRFLSPDLRQSIFEFEVATIEHDSIASLAVYKGKKAYLVVNVASQCGLTNRNYAELQELYEKYG